ncbi:efflux RND transporter periplasmic adaptor subunit [Nitrospira sp. BLG_2]|uniref:efflux RND transporter periplasmic adaptor subunit n=1 Tax=Nitrospira sp. BLG_2 TaxID=3397507 RepID=UPI003B9958BC
MPYRWLSSVMVLLLFMMAVSVSATGRSKEDRPIRVTRQESNIARGIVRASTQAILYAQVQGRISQLPYKEGQRFEKGHTLVQLDCDKYRAELAVAIAEHEAKDKLYKNNIELGKLNAVSELDLETSEAEAKKAFAAIRVAEVNVKGCRIVAPFGGRVANLMVNEHENVFPNDKLISLLDDSSLEIELVLPSSSLSWLRRKETFTFVVDETRRSYRARIREIGASIDPASQTIKVTAAFEKLPPEILAGMSGSAQFSEQP